ncbi:bifunctional diguanylate cyclase/phosphodiesterase [Ferrimonas lipolytica]|uniref:EAL domain-containing protein n=1 Tax=Ferrimonas lipolytica TaxID=2724191 RepID=A0A6H1UDR6_9GAMM|nr:bifunctional diguanylate cyclase/phosphodiesterase [Ferrimonas lipolytica]QIZ77221.1 EAL domain-containing protein [Ferrimonas lipolytica]
MKIWGVVVWLFLCSSALAQTASFQQEFRTQYYGFEQGLTNNNITSMTQGPLGFIWVGTNHGLSRFDGQYFSAYPSSHANQHGLNSDKIWEVLSSTDGTMWALTDNGIYYYDSQFDYFNKISLDHVRSAQITKALPTSNGIVVIDDNRLLFINAEQIQAVAVNEHKLQTLLPHTNQSIYVETANGTHYQVNLLTLEPEKTEAMDSQLQGLAPDGSVGFYKNHIEDGDGNLLHTVRGIRNVKFSQDGAIFSSNSGLYKLSAADHRLQRFYASGSDVIHVDHGGNAWHVAKGVGLSKTYTAKPEFSLMVPTDKRLQSISGITTVNDKLWVSTNSQYLFSLDEQFQLDGQFDLGFAGKKALCGVPNSNILYVGGKTGLTAIDMSNGYRNKLFNSGVVTSINGCGQQLVFGTFTGRVYQLRHGEISQLSLDKSIDVPILAINRYEDTLYFATQSGMYEYKLLNGTLRYQTLRNEGEQVVAVGRYDSTLFIGTLTGAYLYNLAPGADPAPQVVGDNHTVFSAVQDDNNIYAAALNGVFVFNKKRELVTHHFNTSNGAQTKYFPLVFATYGNQILFSGIEGINHLNVAKMSQRHYLAKPIVSQLQVIDQNVHASTSNIIEQAIAVADKIELDHTQMPLSFRLSQLEYHNLDELSLQYRLVGLDEQWLDTDSYNLASFAHIPAGDYQFEYKAILKRSNLESEIGQLTIHVHSPWWLTPVAKIIYALLTLTLIGYLLLGLYRRRSNRLEIQKSEERLKLSLWGSGDEMWDWDIEKDLIYRSNASQQFTASMSPAGFVAGGREIHPTDQSRVDDTLKAHLGDETEHFESTYRIKSGANNWAWILDRAKVVERDKSGKPIRMTGTMRDISQEKQDEARLSLFEKALTNISEGMFILDSNFEYIEVNDSCLRLSGYKREDFIGQPLKANGKPSSYLEQGKKALATNDNWRDEFSLIRADGKRLAVEFSIDRLFDIARQRYFYVGLFSDITLRKQAEARLTELANHDGLTKLFNRSYCHSYIDKLIDSSTPFALLLFDLDNFKRVNDSLGHSAGDQLLCDLTTRIRAALPEQAIVFRLGGDEFAVVYHDQVDELTSKRYAKLILATFVEPYNIDNRLFYMSSSIGIVHYPNDDDSTEALVRKADLAMYHGKRQGGQRYQLFDEELSQQAENRMRLESVMRQGLSENWFEVYYQPKVAADHFTITGMEALVRLRHPEIGLISPAEFIPLAEESDLIIKIGEFVLTEACNTVRRLIDERNFEGRVAVNLSSKQLNTPRLTETVLAVLAKTKVPSRYLELEITESSVIEFPLQAKSELLLLQQKGVTIALDDFGTGYSSLAYLSQLPLNTLKIDKSFVDNVVTKESDRSMLDSIITIAKNLGLTVVAEGIEDRDQLEILQQLQCQVIQGYLFSRPLPENELHKLFDNKTIEPTDA